MLAQTSAGSDLLFQELLGSAVNILEKPNVFDVKSVTDCKKNKAIIKVSDVTKEVSIPGIKGKVNVHKNVDVVSSGNRTTSSDVQVENGSELSESLTANAKASAEYLGMKVEVGGGYSYENTVKKSSMYALMAINQTQFYTELNTGENKADLSPAFLAAVDELPDWSETGAVKSRYEGFFNKWGTHVIERCHYGCRFTMKVETHNAALTNKEEYKANVKAEFGKVFSTDADFKKGNSFEEYQKHRTASSSVTGGNRSSSLELERDPADKDKYNQWAKSTNDAMNSAVTEIQAKTLGQLLNGCGVSKGDEMIKALKHFTKSAEPKPITVEGYLYTAINKLDNYVQLEMWGDGYSDFELGSLDGGWAENTGKSWVKRLFPSEPLSMHGCRSTGCVKIYGNTGQKISFGVWQRNGSNAIRLYLLPPTGPIQIDFDQKKVWNEVTIPNLLASGHYRSG